MTPIAENYTALVACDEPCCRERDYEFIGYSRREVYRAMKRRGWQLKEFENGFAMKAFCPIHAKRKY